MRFLPYEPDQAWLLPPSVKDVLGEDHLCFFVHRVVEQLDLRGFEQAYGEEGPPAYPPLLMVKVWLYAYALGVTSSRRLEQRIREDLAFRYLAGGATPDHWTLNEFRRHHRRAINDLFTQVLELARGAGLGRLGHVAIDSTRVAANASRNRVESEDALRRERAKLRQQVRRWQQQCDAADPNETPGTALDPQEKQAVEERLAEIPRRLQKLRKAGPPKRSRTDPDSRFLREWQGFTLGYTVAMAVSEDHLIVEQRVTQEATDNGSLLSVVDAVGRRCGELPQKVSADSGFFSLANIAGLEAHGIEGYVPDSNLARELKGRGRRSRVGRLHHAEQRHMRPRLRSPAGRAVYRRRKAIIEPVFGVLKEQRGMRRFRLRGLAKVGVEMALAATAYNLTRLWSHQRAVA
jgi:transposase